MELAHYYRKVISHMNAFEDVKCYHVIRNLNQNTDQEANMGVSLSKGVLCLNGINNHVPIP